MPEQPELTIQGWGPPGPAAATDAADLTSAVPKGALRYLTRELGWTPRPTPPVAVDEIRLAPSRLPEEARTRFVELLGEENVRTDRDSRLRRAGGKSYLDLLRRREGDASDAPDAVVLPGTTDETAALLAVCSELGVVVVPFGGGTSVVGGLAGIDPDDRPSVAVDLSRMASVQALDVPSSLVTVGPGMRGPALEQALDRQGLTFGHLPQSWEFATVGGYAATRSAGQNSTGVGRFDELVTGLTLATPSGVLEVDGTGSRVISDPGWFVYAWETDSRRIYGLRPTDDQHHFMLVSLDTQTGTQRVIAGNLGTIPQALQPIRGFTRLRGRGFLTSIAKVRSDIYLLEGLRLPPTWWQRLWPFARPR